MKISIITPCYNAEATIERTIKSVLKQKISCEMEYIIVDGKSSDKTVEIIEKYAKKYNCLKYISEKDNSMTEALNKGIKLASGDLIATINADDIYIKNAVNKVVNVFYSNPKIKVLMVNNYFVDQETGKVLSKNMPRFFNDKICAFIECPFPECGIFFRRECFENVGLFNEKIKYTQDFEFYLRLYYYGYKFYYKNINASVFYRSNLNYSTVLSEKINQEACSYYKYPKTYKIFCESQCSKILKVLLGFRKYYIFN